MSAASILLVLTVLHSVCRKRIASNCTAGHSEVLTASFAIFAFILNILCITQTIVTQLSHSTTRVIYQPVKQTKRGLFLTGIIAHLFIWFVV